MDLAVPGSGRCPDCGARLTTEAWAAGLCLTCLVDLGLSAGAGAETTDPAGAEAPTERLAAGTLEPGQVLGGRYRIRSRLGGGGMGEVFRAFDLKLRVDVALKALRPTLPGLEHARRALRQEVRTAREVVSPNVCRVFDLVEIEGRELVSMEFVDGVTFTDALRERSPLPLQEARELAAQFLAGLEAIHAAGLAHRDVKPENLMLTRAGRVVVMDFGIARALAEAHGGTISGTPAYMAPEQARGEPADARGDVFSAGVVLAEMVAPAGVRSQAARQAVWRGIHEDPPAVGETPWAAVLRKAVARAAELRYPTAAVLSRALEEVTLRSAGDESKRPYPGLASFTDQDAAYFVGRELEIEELWKRMRRPHLLALVGPSGAGKSSFLRAGLAPTTPAGWRVDPRDAGRSSLRGARARPGAGAPGRRRGGHRVRRLRAAGRRRGPRDPLAPPQRARRRRVRPVRGAVHAEPARGAGALRLAAGPPRPRGRRPRDRVDARRLPLPLPPLREPRAALLGRDCRSGRRREPRCGALWFNPRSSAATASRTRRSSRRCWRR